MHLLAALKHPNIVNYYESFLDAHDGRLLIVMELCEVRCCSLAQHIASRAANEDTCQSPAEANA